MFWRLMYLGELAVRLEYAMYLQTAALHRPKLILKIIYICIYVILSSDNKNRVRCQKTWVKSDTKTWETSGAVAYTSLLLSKPLSRENRLSCQEGFEHWSDFHAEAGHLALSWKKSLVHYQYAQFSARHMKWPSDISTACNAHPFLYWFIC